MSRIIKSWITSSALFSSDSHLLICPCQLYSISHQANKGKTCEDKHEKLGVAASQQEQTDSWAGWGAQSKLKSKREKKQQRQKVFCQHYMTGRPRAHLLGVTYDVNA